MSSHDDDDLFGDGDSGDSLFGDDHVSLFDAPDEEDQEGQSPPSCFSKADSQELSNLTLLSFPSVPDPHAALSCGHVGLTSGQHTVSTQDPSGNVWGLSMPEPTTTTTDATAVAVVDAQVFNGQASDTFPVACHDHGDQADHEQQGQTGGAPPEPSLSMDGMMRDVVMMPESDFAQDEGHVDQPDQPINSQAPWPVFQQEAQPAADTQMFFEYNTVHGQAQRGTTTSLGDQPATIGIPIAATEHHLAEAQTQHGIRLPRRMDYDGADVSVLTPYLTLNRADSAALHYERLALPERHGKRLLREMKLHVKLSPEVQHLKQGGRLLTTEDRRLMFLKAALRLLKCEGWGEKWFGQSSPTGRIRTLLWPCESTLILMRFACLLYKVADQVKNQDRVRARSAQRYPIEGQSQASPIDLTNDDNGTDGVTRDLTPSTAPSFSRPGSSHMSVSQASTSGMAFSDQGAASRRPSVALPAYRSPAFGIPVTAPDFYITEDTRPLGESAGPGQTNSIHQQNAPSKGIALSTLAEQIVSAKQRKKGPAPIPLVRYRLSFTDSNDQQALRSPIVGTLADEIIQKGKVVETIQSAFSRAGAAAVINILSDNGPVRVQTQEEWDGAIGGVWAKHGNGAVVQVNIRV